MKVIESILMKNPCYQTEKTIEVKGLMLHSVGCPQPRASVFLSLGNHPSYHSACVHAFIDDGVIIGTRLEKPSKINGFALLSPIFLSHAGWREDGAVHINTYYTESQMGLCA